MTLIKSPKSSLFQMVSFYFVFVSSKIEQTKPDFVSVPIFCYEIRRRKKEKRKRYLLFWIFLLLLSLVGNSRSITWLIYQRDRDRKSPKGSGEGMNESIISHFYLQVSNKKYSSNLIRTSIHNDCFQSFSFQSIRTK